MLLEKEILNDLKENYAKVRKLLDDNCKFDPESEPYLSKYAARAILVHMKHSLNDCLEKIGDRPQKLKIVSMLGAVFYNIGVINLDTEQTAESETVLTEGEHLLEDYRLHPQVVLVLVNIYNHLGILWSNRDDIEKTEQYLTKANKVYSEFKASKIEPFDINQLFNGTDEDESGQGMLSLEKAHTLTLYYMAQVYGAQKQNANSAHLCQITLKRQLKYKDYEPVDWALNSATLSQYFAESGEFDQARSHLAAATIVLREATCEDERKKHRTADIARCWAKYCLLLMSASKERLMNDEENKNNVTEDIANLSINTDEELDFYNLDLSEFTDKITSNYLLTFPDARKVFLSCQEFLNQAKEYYKLDTLASDYIEIIQDTSQSYNYLAIFEEDDERRAKMHKRRINLLEELVNEINPTYYMQYCRQLWYELGEIYTDMLNIKLEKLKKLEDRPSPQALQKVNLLAEQSINYFEKFLDTIKEPSSLQGNSSLPNKIDSQVVRPALTALVLIARNKMKIITPNKAAHLKNLKESEDAYLKVVEYCKRDQEAADAMREEISLCQEMATMLPLKIKKLESESL